jgi:sialic acid synthase SpsE
MKVEIIAEMAQGFEGNYTQAKLLIKAAASAGADAAKFQLVYADELATPDYEYYNLFKSLEMKDEEWASLEKYSTENNIKLYLDVFGIKSLSLCERIGIKAIKLHPTDITNISLLKSVSKSNINNIIIGAGGANLNEIENALAILKNKTVDLLLGFQSYPTETKDNQICRVKTLENTLENKFSNFRMGFADHAQPNDGLKYAIACTAIGAGSKVLEKHLTLGKVMEMEDHESALNPDEFKDFVYIIKECAASFGSVKGISNDFNMSNSEKKYRKVIRRHVVASKPLEKGHIIQSEDVLLKRTASKNIIYDLNEVYGEKLKIDLKKNSALNFNNI